MKAWLRGRPALAVTIAALGLVIGLICIISALNRVSCAWYGYQTERDTRYAAFVGCMVKMPVGWVPRAEIRTAQ